MSVIACFAYTTADCSFQVEYANGFKPWSVCSLMHFNHHLQVVCSEKNEPQVIKMGFVVCTIWNGCWHSLDWVLAIDLTHLELTEVSTSEWEARKSVLSLFSQSCDKTRWQRQLKKERLDWLPVWELGPSWWGCQGCSSVRQMLTSCGFHSQETVRWRIPAARCPFSLCAVQNLNQETHSGLDFSPLSVQSR